MRRLKKSRDCLRPGSAERAAMNCEVCVSNRFGDRFAQTTTTRRRNNGRPLAANPDDHQREGQADNYRAAHHQSEC